MHTVYKSISSCSGPVGTPMLFTSVNAIVCVNQPTRVLANGRRMATYRAAGVGARAAVQLPIYTPSNRVDEPTRQEALAQVDNALHTTILDLTASDLLTEAQARSCMETLSIMLPDWRGELSTMAEARGSTALLRVEVELQALNAFNLDRQEPIVLQTITQALGALRNDADRRALTDVMLATQAAFIASRSAYRPSDGMAAMRVPLQRIAALRAAQAGRMAACIRGLLLAAARSGHACASALIILRSALSGNVCRLVLSAPSLLAEPTGRLEAALHAVESQLQAQAAAGTAPTVVRDAVRVGPMLVKTLAAMPPPRPQTPPPPPLSSPKAALKQAAPQVLRQQTAAAAAAAAVAEAAPQTSQAVCSATQVPPSPGRAEQNASTPISVLAPAAPAPSDSRSAVPFTPKDAHKPTTLHGQMPSNATSSILNDLDGSMKGSGSSNRTESRGVGAPVSLVPPPGSAWPHAVGAKSNSPHPLSAVLPAASSMQSCVGHSSLTAAAGCQQGDARQSQQPAAPVGRRWPRTGTSGTRDSATSSGHATQSSHSEPALSTAQPVKGVGPPVVGDAHRLQAPANVALAQPLVSQANVASNNIMPHPRSAAKPHIAFQGGNVKDGQGRARTASAPGTATAVPVAQTLVQKSAVSASTVQRAAAGTHPLPGLSPLQGGPHAPVPNHLDLP